MADAQANTSTSSAAGAAASSGAPGSARRGRFRKPGRWFAAATVLLVVSTWVAVRQQPGADVYRVMTPRDAAWWLQPIEFNGPRRLPLVWSDLNDVFVLRSYGEVGPQVWVVGNDGLILHSPDLGRRWRRLGLATPVRSVLLTPGEADAVEDLKQVNLRSVWFVEPQTGWVAGDHGALFATRDGGETWTRQEVSEPAGGARLELPLSQLVFESPANGWLTAGAWWDHEAWSRYETADGGRHWLRAKSLDLEHLVFGSGFVGARLQLQELEQRSAVLPDLNDWPAARPLFWRRGRHFGDQRVPTGETILALDQKAANELWVVGTNGTAMRTDDNGRTWTSRGLGTQERLTSIQFLDARHGWITGAAGTLLATEDGGDTWFRQTRRTSAMGGDAIANRMLAARDAVSLGPYSMWLAPWYFLSLIVVGALLVPALKPQEPVADPQPSVAERLVSDRAIERREADAFDFNAVALGLSRFLRNAKTEPPLTIAVTGEWGSGKNSLMNLLRADLERYGFRPVWFNAWHHQKEEHLLASLLEAVRAQGVPPWWRPEGALFRAKLLRLRAARYWPLVTLLLIAFSFSAGYIRAEPERIDALEKAAASLAGKLNAPGWWGEGAAEKAAAPADPRQPKDAPRRAAGAAPAAGPGTGAEPLPLTALVVTTAGLLAAAKRGAKAFGVNPARLLARRSTKVRDLEALTGFRHRFAAEFNDVTAALNPRTMLIVIDDLDRCRPEMVLEVLEAVNFLVTSGDCFVVLGMARDRVLRCVGLSFKDVASELLDWPAEPPAGLTKEDVERQRRLEFAQQYLEKLINIEVPVPLPTDEQSRRLLVDERPAAPPPPPAAAGRWQRWLGAMRRALPAVAIGLLRETRRALPAAALVLLVIGGFLAGLARPPAPPPALGPLSSPARFVHERPRPTPVPDGERRDGRVGDGGPDVAAPVPAPPPVLAEPLRWQRLPFVLLGLVLAGFGVWRLSIPPDVVIHDSREFEEALSRWHPLIFSWRNTPRAIKRYLNRVRYLAMLQREPVATPALWKRLVEALRMRGDGPGSAGGLAPIPEQVLVALSALELRHPAWITGDRPLAAYALEPGSDPQIVRLLADRRDLEFYRYRYRELARGIRGSAEGQAA